jgi:hypothetical protein
MMYEYEAVRGNGTGRANRSARTKPAPLPLCTPQISRDLTWDWTWAAAVGSRWLTAMARPSTHSLTSANGRFHNPASLPAEKDITPQYARRLNKAEHVQAWTIRTETVPQQFPVTKRTNWPDAGHVAVITGSDAVRSSCATPNTGWSPLDMVHYTSNLGWWTLLPQHHFIQMSHNVLMTSQCSVPPRY